MVSLSGMRSVLFRKLLRDLWAHKVSLISIILIVGVGVQARIVMTSVWHDLNDARSVYYRDYRLADFSINLKRAPEHVVETIGDFPNVKAARGRIAVDALIDLPNETRPISGRILSLPEPRKAVLNDVLLRRGTWFSGESNREAIVNQAFARANGIEPGDRIEILLLDRKHSVLVVGLATSPEFVYLIPPGGGVAPDPGRFGVIYLPEDFLQRSADLDGAVNEVLGTVINSDEPVLRDTLSGLESRLEPWGVTESTPAEDQPSVRFLRDELIGLRVSSKIMPFIFLGVAMLVLNVLMNRLVAQQRSVIGTLKAIGRSTFEITLHFVMFGAVTALVGGLVGSAVALWLQPKLVALYGEYYDLPGLEPHIYLRLHLVGIVVSLIFAIAGTLFAARKAARIEPAQAMRPAPPERGGRILLERIGALWRRLPFRWHLILRAIFRNPFRSTVTCLSAVVATALMLASFNMVDALDYLMDYQFKSIAHQDVTISLREAEGTGVFSEIGSVSGLNAIEPQLNVSCELEHGPRKKRIGVTGLPQDNRLFTPLNASGEAIAIPETGLVLTDKLARMLQVETGDALTLRPSIGERRRVTVPVVGIVETFLGLSAYADIRFLSRLIGEEWAANTLLGMTNRTDRANALFVDLQQYPSVVGFSERERALERVQETFGETQGTMLFILLVFAGLIAFGSVLNAALISLSEREREVGTFRVLGYWAEEIAMIFRREQLVLIGVGIALGLAAGYALSHGLSVAYDTELYRFPVRIRPIRLVETVLLMGLFGMIAQWFILRTIRRLDWMEAQKIRE